MLLLSDRLLPGSKSIRRLTRMAVEKAWSESPSTISIPASTPAANIVIRSGARSAAKPFGDVVRRRDPLTANTTGPAVTLARRERTSDNL